MNLYAMAAPRRRPQRIAKKLRARYGLLHTPGRVRRHTPVLSPVERQQLLADYGCPKARRMLGLSAELEVEAES